MLGDLFHTCPLQKMLRELALGPTQMMTPCPKVKALVTQLCLTLCDPMVCSQNSPGKNTGVGGHSPSPGDPSDPGIKPGSPALQTDFFYLYLSHKGSPQKTLFKILLEEEKMLNIKISLDPDSFPTFDGKV